MLTPLRNLLAKSLSHDQFLHDSLKHANHRIEEIKKYEKRRSIPPHPNPSRTTPPGYCALSSPHVAQLPESPIQNLVTQNPLSTSSLGHNLVAQNRLSTSSPGHNLIQTPSPS